MKCPKCHQEGAHFVPPSFGEEGFYICKDMNKQTDLDAARAIAKLLMGEHSLGTPQEIEDQFTRVIAAALRAERGRAIDYLKDQAKRIPVGDERDDNGASTYNWYRHIIKDLEHWWAQEARDA